jgi:hypothetical protein
MLLKYTIGTRLDIFFLNYKIIIVKVKRLMYCIKHVMSTDRGKQRDQGWSSIT